MRDLVNGDVVKFEFSDAGILDCIIMDEFLDETVNDAKDFDTDECWVKAVTIPDFVFVQIDINNLVDSPEGNIAEFLA